MKVAIYKALWGMTGSWEVSFKQIAEAGYDGVEAGLPGPQDQQRKARDLEVHPYSCPCSEIYQHRSKEGAECLSVTTEFGPPNYLHTLPFSNEPVANLWEVCDWMRQFIAAEIAHESFNE